MDAPGPGAAVRRSRSSQLSQSSSGSGSGSGGMRGMRYTAVVPRWSIGEFGDEGAVYYVVLVEMQRDIVGKGTSTMKRSMLRRFRDFIRLHQGLSQIQGIAHLLPDPPPKLRLRAVNTSAALIEQRRRKLQDWLWGLLSIPRVATSKPVALFLELEAHAILLQEEAASVPTNILAGDDSSSASSSGSVIGNAGAGAATGETTPVRPADAGVTPTHGGKDRGESARATHGDTQRNIRGRDDDDDDDDDDDEIREAEEDMAQAAAGDPSSGGFHGGGQQPLPLRRSKSSMSTGALEQDGIASAAVLPLARRRSLAFLVNDVTSKAHVAMECLLRAERERDAAIEAASHAERVRQQVVAECEARSAALEQDRVELEASVREKEVRLSWR